MAPQASISFDGLSGIRGFEFPFGRGISPSVATLYVLPFDPLDLEPGTLRIAFGTTEISLTNCAVSAAFLRKRNDQRWPIWSIHVLDRRWKWNGPRISGNWNVRTSDGIVDPATQKTPGELATMLLQALGESGFDVSRMPGNVRPRALWENVRADLTLQSLCDSVACDVVLNPLTDAVEIWPLGVGETTPTGSGELLPKYRYVPRTNVPATIEVRCGPSLFQSRLLLTAVARNRSTSNQKKITNWEALAAAAVSYESPFSFPDMSDNNNRALAFEEYFREYRVVGQENGTTQPPNCQVPVSAVDQYILNDYVLDTETDLEGYKRTLPAYIDGDYWSYTDLPNNVSSQRYTGSFKLFQDRRLVQFPYPIFKLTSTGAYSEPSLYLTTSYKIESTAGELVGLYRQGAVAGGSGKLILNHPEIFSIYSTSTVPGMNTNTQAQAFTEADAYIALFQQQYSNPTAYEMEYAGLLPFSLDGNIAQITWKLMVNQGTCSTTVCEHEELNVAAVDRNERRRREKLEALL